MENVIADAKTQSVERDAAFISGLRKYKHYLIGIAIGAGIPLGLFLIFILWIVGQMIIFN